jgi:hypothetical protein
MKFNRGPDDLLRQLVHNYYLCVLRASAVRFVNPIHQRDTEIAEFGYILFKNSLLGALRASAVILSYFPSWARRAATSSMKIFLSIGLVT